jgi:hypothetical protein
LPIPKRDDTYPYDGGPRNPVPQPGNNDPAPSATPKRTVPLEGKPVSLPAPVAKTQFAYPAYGESTTKKTTGKTVFAEDRVPTERKDAKSLAGK